MNNRTRLIALGVVGVLVLGWAATRLERVNETEWSRMSGEARRNPFLAAQRLMARMGLPAREAKSLRDLDQLPARALLVLPSHRQAMTPEVRGKLLGWVERGGHLMVETEALGVPDPLVDALVVQREPAARVHGKDDKATLPHAPVPLRVSGLGAHQRLVVPKGAQTRVETGWGLQLAQLTRGKGLITVATDLAFAENQRIGELDHAEFLWQLARTLPRTSEFIVYSRMERLSLWRWVLDHALVVLIPGVVLLVLWLWRIGPRFGPIAADPAPSRRRLLDHLRASGRFYWRNQGRARLVEAAREACLARLARAQPGFALLPPEERIAQLAAYAGISATDATQLLLPGEVRRGAEFIALIRTLQDVHARLDRGSNG